MRPCSLEPKQRVVPFGPGLALAQPLVEPVPRRRRASRGYRDRHRPGSAGLHRRLCGAWATPDGSIPAFARSGRHRHRGRRSRHLPSVPNGARALRRTQLFGGVRGHAGFGDGLEELRADVGPKPRALTPTFLREVARIYREADARRQHPAKAVQEQLGGPERAPRPSGAGSRVRVLTAIWARHQEGQSGEQRGGK